MRWLLVKDLQILKRSPLLVGLLVVYPIVLSVLIGFALSRGPDKPKVAFLNLVPKTENRVSLGGEDIDVSKYSDQLFEAIDPVRIDCKDRDAKACEREAIQMVRDGEVLAALVIPADITRQLQSAESLGGGPSPKVKVYYNAEDPAKRRYVESTIESRLQDANAELTKKFTEVALDYLDLIVKGGTFDVPGSAAPSTILGLENSEAILRAVQAEQPRGSPAERSSSRSSASPSWRRRTSTSPTTCWPRSESRSRSSRRWSRAGRIALVVRGRVRRDDLADVRHRAARRGVLALEREENAFPRLVRGLVSPTACSRRRPCSRRSVARRLAPDARRAGAVRRARLGPFPFWLVGLAAGALGFAAMGLAIGALAREVRAASLLAFMLRCRSPSSRSSRRARSRPASTTLSRSSRRCSRSSRRSTPWTPPSTTRATYSSRFCTCSP